MPLASFVRIRTLRGVFEEEVGVRPFLNRPEQHSHILEEHVRGQQEKRKLSAVR
jgi:hypothetical protein